MSQVNFLMTANDEAAFVSALFDRVDTQMVVGDSFDVSPPSLATLDDVLTAAPSRPIILLHSELSFPVRCSAFQDGQYRFDLFRDAHIAFNRCIRQDNQIIAGRMYAKIGWLESREANKAYQSWYGSLDRWIKKRYERLHEHWWVGPDALQWSRGGGILSLGGELAMKVSLAIETA